MNRSFELNKNKVSLRALKEEDIPTFAILANNKKIFDNVRDVFPHPYSENDAATFINLKKDEDPITVFAIESNGHLCGAIGLVRKEDVYRNTAEIGYWLGEPFWRKGIMTNAIKLMVEYGFNSLKLQRIEAGIFEYNLASMRALEKNGFKKEGIGQKAITKNEKRWDEHRYAKIAINPQS